MTTDRVDGRRDADADRQAGDGSALRVVGPLSVDRYLDEGIDLPGGGALNVATHWARDGRSVDVLSRVATSAWGLVAPFLRRNRIDTTDSIVVPGEPCSIDIRFAEDRQPVMDGFVAGVMADFRLTEAERDRVLDGTPTHFVLVDAVDHELRRIASERPSAMGAVRWSGDFLSFVHMTPDRFSDTMRHLDLGIVGWPGSPEDPMVGELADRATEARSILVVTFGAAGVLVRDGRDASRSDQWFDVTARPVAGTTVGCGDAFAAAMLATWWSTGHLPSAVAAGIANGAAATEWRRPLPDAAYGSGVRFVSPLGPSR